MKSLKNDFSLMSSLLIPVAVAINFTGFGLVKLLQVPIFLDSIGTVFISLIAGPWVGVVTAVITSLITGSFSPEYFAFIPVAVIMALTMGFLARFRMKNIVIKTLVCAFCLVFSDSCICTNNSNGLWWKYWKFYIWSNCVFPGNRSKYLDSRF